MLKIPVSDEDHIQGSKEFLVTLTEYGDYECPFCGLAYPIVKQVQEHFGPQLRFVFRNFPLTEMHAMAEPAAETAEFAGSQGLYWKMHDLIYENQQTLSLELLFELAEALNFPQEKLNEVLRNRPFASKIHKDFMGGVKSGVNGTPTFFLNNDRFPGPIEFEPLVLAINEVIKST